MFVVSFNIKTYKIIKMNRWMKAALGIILLGLMLFSTISFALINSVSALTIDSVSVVDKIQPGKTTRITMSLENDANEDIEDVSVVLDLTDVPFAPFDSASEYGIDEISEDDREFAEFNLIALNNAKAGIYKIPIKITYIQDGDEKVKSSLISIVVDSKPELGVSVDDSLILKGQDNEFSLEINNKGLSDAKFVEVEIGQGQYELISSKRQYIGDIDSDDFESFRVKAFFKDSVGNVVNMPVTVIYKDDLNNQYTEVFNVNLNVYSESKAVELGLMEKNNTFGYVIGILFIVVLYFVYRRLRKRAKEKGNGRTL